MANWNQFKSRITASVRTTNRMNTFLNESLQANKKKLIAQRAKKCEEDSDEGADPKSKLNIVFLKTNFNLEHVYKVIQETVEDRIQWDRFSRAYDPWRSVQLAESLSIEIKDRVKKLKYKRYRIVCLLSVVEKLSQGVHLKASHLLDPRRDNFTNFFYECGTYCIIVTVWLVYKD